MIDELSSIKEVPSVEDSACGEEQTDADSEESDPQPSKPLIKRLRSLPKASWKEKYESIPIYFKNLIAGPFEEPEDEFLVKRQYETVGDSESEFATDWEQYMDQLWHFYEEKAEPEWRKLVKYKAEYWDEIFSDSDASPRTLREYLARQKRKRTRKKFLSRDRDRDYRLNTSWKCELPPDDYSTSAAEVAPSSRTSSISLSASSLDSDGLPKTKNLPPAKIIRRSEELVNRLFHYKNVDGVVILIEESYGSIKHESFAIMVFQSVDKEDLQIRPIHPLLPLRDQCTFPKVWLSGMETRPVTPSQQHLTNFRKATGLEPLRIKKSKNKKALDPLIRSGLHATSVQWRQPLPPLEAAYSTTPCRKNDEPVLKF
ncbi:uncharacterized protein isoform X2 [Rhodnius prolixus]|uniref:uncharacterized protein isoform X2 n=1 Tax=Rhodnius prolixus TaxID=13249 RepID=UPI003D18D2DD